MHDLQSILQLFDQAFFDLLYQAQTLHRENFNPQEVQLSTLLSIKTGSCPEDCAYCPQSAHYKTGQAELEKSELLDLDTVLEKAKLAQKKGASRFCMGAAWKSPNAENLSQVTEMVRAVKDLGLETCVTLGSLDQKQAEQLSDAGLDYYNHNLDTSPEMYEKIISTRTYQDRLDTLEHVNQAGLKVCCGGIVGLGETRQDRAELFLQLLGLSKTPESIPINQLVQVEGTPLYGVEELDEFEFVRSIAVARILFPKSRVRLSAGRETMSASTQALCFFAGANSIFYGEKLLTTDNPSQSEDEALFEKLQILAV